jgi:hypothetical protein
LLTKVKCACLFLFEIIEELSNNWPTCTKYLFAQRNILSGRMVEKKLKPKTFWKKKVFLINISRGGLLQQAQR